MKLKMYVWEDVLRDYTEGMMVALAKDVNEAREMIRKKCDYIGDDLMIEPKEITKPEGFVVWGGG